MAQAEGESMAILRPALSSTILVAEDSVPATSFVVWSLLRWPGPVGRGAVQPRGCGNGRTISRPRGRRRWRAVYSRQKTVYPHYVYRLFRCCGILPRGEQAVWPRGLGTPQRVGRYQGPVDDLVMSRLLGPFFLA